jgi:hypothetical protein
MATRNVPERHRPDPFQEDRPRKRAHPLFWLLVLLALFALGWSFYNHHAGESTPAPIRPAAPDMASPQAPVQNGRQAPTKPSANGRSGVA